MIVKITSKRQVTFPAHVLDAMGVGPGDHLEITEGTDGFIIRPRRIDNSKLAPHERPDTLQTILHLIYAQFRDGTYDPALRD